jgi:hypothetical protein
MIMRREAEKNRGGDPPTNSATRGKSLQDLMLLESEIIDKLWAVCQVEGMADRERVQYFNVLSSHAKTLAKLLKLAGVKGDESQDLAKMLQQIATQARRIARGKLFGEGIEKVRRGPSFVR